ncbi:MAG: hypothetical protein OXI05_10535 [Bacteroidota bacterium]|nr:hypothetical protein [Bacteroidota bacterium]MDE2646254.1 hypothetical protein [Bacteroidota bacterium]
MKTWATLGAVLFVLMVIVLIFRDGCNGEAVDSLEVQVEMKPQWDDSGSETVDPDSITPEFHLLWDQSIPMGGYVHRTHPDSQAALKSISDLLKRARLTTDYGGGESSLKCLGITNSISSVDCNSAMLRGFFNGNSSRLDQGIKYVIEGLISGTFRGAALVSDLIATTDDVIGAAALLPYFKNPAIRAYYNSGEIDIALIGIRMDYWGVHLGSCQTTSSRLGCEFDDFQNRYRPLDNVVKRPIYVLIMGRRSEGNTREGNSVTDMASEFVKSITSQGLEIKHEALTQGPLGGQSIFQWHRYSQSGFEPVGLTAEGYYCKDNESHRLVGGFMDGGLSIIEIEIHGSLETVTASVDRDNAQQVDLELNCRSLREKLRDDQLEVCNESPNKLVGSVEYQGQGEWADWSSDLHVSNKTPGLAQFLNGIRPSHYEVIIEPAPPLNECAGDS